MSSSCFWKTSSRRKPSPAWQTRRCDQASLSLRRSSGVQMLQHVQEAMLENPTLEIVPDSAGAGPEGESELRNRTERDLWLACMQAALAKQSYPADLQTYLLRELGVPAERIRLYPPPGCATEEDVIEIQTHEDRLYELGRHRPVGRG